MMYHPCLLEKVVFFVSKILLSSIGIGKKRKKKKTFLSTLNFMISQMVSNESVKFGRYVEKQVNYKILQLKVSNNLQTLHNPPWF